MSLFMDVHNIEGSRRTLPAVGEYRGPQVQPVSAAPLTDGQASANRPR